MKAISILGSTGSIGCNTLKVVEHLGDDFRVVALGAGKNVAKLAEQIARFKPELVSVEDENCAENLLKELHTGTYVRPAVPPTAKLLPSKPAEPGARVPRPARAANLNVPSAFII